ncbi:hypothetical protein [Carboxylicivirga marina]|uniref:Uncharacterized protein n=1 Tax=Carboxylicivirga marina TaxID=2800988 RepID=A0ABS1HMS9_9BACT|nr:hypothetical protein [Carboxylicivirga marina]MBK3518479.1 hypothetical protein [Carboxylicivirga marina]
MIAISGIVIITVILIRTLLSFKFEKDDYSRTTDDLRNEFQRKDFLILLLFFISIPLFATLNTNALESLSEMVISVSDSVFIIKPEFETWLLLALMMSFGISVIVVFSVANTVFKEKASQYWIYYNRKYRTNATAILKYLSVILISGSSLLICLQLNTFIKFNDEAVVINQSLDFADTEYQYDQIDKLVHYDKKVAPNGSIIDKPYYAIHFGDNFIWRTTDGLRTPHIDDDKIFKFLSDKTKLVIEEFEIEQN